MDETEEEIQRIEKVYAVGVYEKGWIRLCAERAVKLNFIRINAPFYPIGTFFEQATRCYIQGLPKGCVALCRATLEAILEHKTNDYNSGLESLVSKCQGNILTDEAFKDTKFITAWGNPYAHADQRAWENANNGMKTTFIDQPFERFVADEKIALECMNKLRNILVILYPEMNR